MSKEPKIHLFDREEHMKVPNWNTAKACGLQMTACGYMRALTTHDENKVTCKLCLKEIEKKHR